MKNENEVIDDLNFTETTENIRRNFSYFIDQAYHHKNKIGITRRGKIVAKIVPAEYDFRDVRRK